MVDEKEVEKRDRYRKRLSEATNFRHVWEIVKDSVKDILGLHRAGMMLFLDDLPLRLGAYHPAGTNNIVMNRALLEIVKSAAEDRIVSMAFIYNILLHEYLHALGFLSEAKVQSLVLRIVHNCFDANHEVAQLAKGGLWSILRDVPFDAVQVPNRVIETVKDFESPAPGYIV